jgi:hypothetical protein
LLGDGVEDFVANDEYAVFLHCLCECDAKPAREVVVAAARVADCMRTGSLSERGDLLWGRDARHSLDELGDLRAGEREVSVPSVGRGGDQAGVDEPGEMMAHGRCCNTRLSGQHACRQRAAAGERK